MLAAADGVGAAEADPGEDAMFRALAHGGYAELAPTPNSMKRPLRRHLLILLLIGGATSAILAIMWQRSHAWEREARRRAAMDAVGEISRRAIGVYEREPTCSGMIPPDEAARCADRAIPVETRLRTCSACSLPTELLHHLCLSAGHPGDADAGEEGEEVDDRGVGVVGWRCLGHSGKAPEGVVLEYVADVQPDGGGWFEARATGDFEDHEPLDRYVVRGQVRTAGRFVVIGEASYEAVP